MKPGITVHLFAVVLKWIDFCLLITCKHSHIRQPDGDRFSSNESSSPPFRPHEVKPHTHTHTCLCLQVCFHLSAVSRIKRPASPEAARLPGRKRRRRCLRRLMRSSFKRTFQTSERQAAERDGSEGRGGGIKTNAPEGSSQIGEQVLFHQVLEDKRSAASQTEEQDSAIDRSVEGCGCGVASCACLWSVVWLWTPTPSGPPKSRRRRAPSCR